MNLFSTAESFNLVRYLRQDSNDKHVNPILNGSTFFLGEKDFEPMALFKYLTQIYAVSTDVFREYAFLKLREEDQQLSVVLNTNNPEKADAFSSYIGNLFISAQKCGIYLNTQFDSKSRIDFLYWLKKQPESEKLTLNYYQQVFKNAHGDNLARLNEAELQKPVLLSLMITKFKQTTFSATDIAQLI
jgi:hypothetical protein